MTQHVRMRENWVMMRHLRMGCDGDKWGVMAMPRAELEAALPQAAIHAVGAGRLDSQWLPGLVGRRSR